MLREKWLQYFPNDIITPHCQAGKNSPSKKSEKLPYYPRDLAHILSKAQLSYLSKDKANYEYVQIPISKFDDY